MAQINIDKSKFEKRVGDRQRFLSSRNKKYLGTGNIHQYQCNCNELKGIAFALNSMQLSKIRSKKEEHKKNGNKT